MTIKNLHLKKVWVENYKSLKGSEIELKEGLNIMIGKNGAGKSNMLDFIYRYPDYLTLSFFGNVRPSNVNYSVSFEYKKNKKRQLFSFSLERVKLSEIARNGYELTINKTDGENKVIQDKKFLIKGTLNKFYSEDEDLYQEFMKLMIPKRYVSFLIPHESTWVSKSTRIVIDRDNQDEISPDEETYFGFFRNLEFDLNFKIIGSIIKENTDVVFLKGRLMIFLNDYLNQTFINLTLNQYTLIEAIRFNPNVNIYNIEQKIIIENLYIDFLIDDEWMPWSYLSDGTKRIFYLISEALSLSEGILLIEEPELGIHPHQLYKIMDFLKEQSRDKQIIISTHSPLVLDVLEEKELDRIIIAKYDNGTKFNHLSKEEISKAKKYMNEVGELSYYWLHSDLEK